MQIVVDERRCSGCRACEVACAAHHEGRFTTAYARVRIAKDEAVGLDRPVLCGQCADTPCVSACPAGALDTDGRTGAVRLDAGDCIACPACSDACPLDAVFVDPTSGLPLICDLCGGRPECVRNCATGALSLSAADARLQAGASPYRRGAVQRPGADRA